MTKTALALGAVLALLAVGPAEACIVHIDLNLTRVREADAIAVGTVTKFDPQLPTEPSRLSKWLSPIRPTEKVNDARAWTDGARVTFRVKEVISGDLPPTVIVDWPLDTNNGPPNQMSGNYLFAVQNKSDANGNPKPTHNLLHQGCSRSFVFRRGSSAANTIREMYGLWPERLEAEPKTLSELLKPPSIPWYILVATGILTLAGVQIVVVLIRGQRASRRG